MMLCWRSSRKWSNIAGTARWRICIWAIISAAGRITNYGICAAGGISGVSSVCRNGTELTRVIAAFWFMPNRELATKSCLHPVCRNSSPAPPRSPSIVIRGLPRFLRALFRGPSFTVGREVGILSGCGSSLSLMRKSPSVACRDGCVPVWMNFRAAPAISCRMPAACRRGGNALLGPAVRRLWA